MTGKLTDEELHLIRDNLHPTHRPHYALLCRLLDEHAELTEWNDAAVVTIGNIVREKQKVFDHNDELRAKLTAAEKERDEQRSQKDFAYSERNKLVSLISKIFPSALGRHSDLDTAWEDDWRWIVFVTLPTGQASWHIHDSDLPLFAHLKREVIEWDGHTTEEKYRRIEQVSIDCILSGNENVRARREALMAGDNPSLDGTPNAHPAFWRGQAAIAVSMDNTAKRCKEVGNALANFQAETLAAFARQIRASIPKKDGG